MRTNFTSYKNLIYIWMFTGPFNKSYYISFWHGICYQWQNLDFKMILENITEDEMLLSIKSNFKVISQVLLTLCTFITNDVYLFILCLLLILY